METKNTKNVSSLKNVIYICPMEDKKTEFLLKALGVYMKFGVKSVTMDEMARQLGISKKTIYTFVKDKNDLVLNCINVAHNSQKCEIETISSKEENAIDQLLKIGELVSQRLRAVHPSIFFDLQRYHPDAFEILKSGNDSLVVNHVKANIVKGKEQGLYRENIDENILSKMYVSFVDVLFRGELFSSQEYSYIQVYSEYFRYHIRGMASDKGLKYLQQLINDNKIEI
ncbi:MAG: TetR/AcrR family transcriptional regulator [Putridiphycobacter sp.]